MLCLCLLTTDNLSAGRDGLVALREPAVFIFGTAGVWASFTDQVVDNAWYPDYACHYYPYTSNDNGNANVVTVTASGPANVPLRAAGSSGPNTINLTATGTPSGGAYSWSTTSSKVTLSNTTSATVTVTSASASTAVGDVPVKVTYTYGGKSANATRNVTVQKPTKLAKVGTDLTTTEAPCTTGGGLSGCGVDRYFTYQVLDQIGAGSPINVSGMPFWDSIVTTSPDDLHLTGYTTTCDPPNTGPCGQLTDSNGRFSEHLGVCSTYCKSGGTCCTAGSTGANQTWNVNGFSLTSDVKALSYQCDRILVNGN
mgnify:CR=1 FL=1